MDCNFCLVVGWWYTAWWSVYIEHISFSKYSLDKLFFFSHSPGQVVDFSGRRLEINEVGNKLNEIFATVLMSLLWFHLLLTFSEFIRRQDNSLPSFLSIYLSNVENRDSGLFLELNGWLKVLLLWSCPCGSSEDRNSWGSGLFQTSRTLPHCHARGEDWG